MIQDFLEDLLIGNGIFGIVTAVVSAVSFGVGIYEIVTRRILGRTVCSEEIMRKYAPLQGAVAIVIGVAALLMTLTEFGVAELSTPAVVALVAGLVLNLLVTSLISAHS